METKIKELLEKLDFDGCLKLYEELPSGSPIMDFLFERMEAINPVRFEIFLG